MPGFAARVAAVIETLAEADSAELRASCFFQASEGLATCADRVAITFSDIEMACKAHRILQAGGGHDQMARLLKGLFRMSALDHFARNAIAHRRGGIDQIEVFLAYRVGLKDELALPCETGAMLYNAYSGVDRAALDRAKAYVLKAESADGGEALVEFAIEQPFWKTHMGTDTCYQEKNLQIEHVSQKELEELEDRADSISDEDYIKGCNALSAKRDNLLKNVLREYTRGILDAHR